MENGVILDSQITASSEYGSNYAAHQGRLHFKAGGGKSGGWLSSSTNSYQWFDIDLGHPNTIVTALATQGRNDANQWVKKYRMQYRVWSGESYRYFIEQGQSVYKVRNNFNINRVQNLKSKKLEECAYFQKYTVYPKNDTYCRFSLSRNQKVNLNPSNYKNYEFQIG